MIQALRPIMDALAMMAKEGYNVDIFSHGSGPQIGILFERVLASIRAGMVPLPLHYMAKDVIASIGMTLRKLIYNIAVAEGLPISHYFGSEVKGIVTLPTNLIVDPNDMEPRKPVGRPLLSDEIEALRGEGYTVEDRDGKGERLLVPSPRVLGMWGDDLVSLYVNMVHGHLMTIAGGGGGEGWEVPLWGGSIESKSAVIDKDEALAKMLIDLFNKKGKRFDAVAVITDLLFMVRDFEKASKAIEEAGGREEIEARGGHEWEDILKTGGLIRDIKVSDMRAILAEGIRLGTISGGAIKKIQSVCDMVEIAQAGKAVICSVRNLAAGLRDADQATTVLPD